MLSLNSHPDCGLAHLRTKGVDAFLDVGKPRKSRGKRDGVEADEHLVVSEQDLVVRPVRTRVNGAVTKRDVTEMKSRRSINFRDAVWDEAKVFAEEQPIGQRKPCREPSEIIKRRLLGNKGKVFPRVVFVHVLFVAEGE